MDVPEPTPEPETKPEAGSEKQQTSGGFVFTADGDIGESSTREKARGKFTEKISELEARLDAIKALKKIEKMEKSAIGYTTSATAKLLGVSKATVELETKLEEQTNTIATKLGVPPPPPPLGLGLPELETRLEEQTKATKKTARIKPKPKLKKKSRQQELEEYEKKYLKGSETKVSRKTYKVKATRKTVQRKPKPEPKKKSRQQ